MSLANSKSSLFGKGAPNASATPANIERRVSVTSGITSRLSSNTQNSVSTGGTKSSSSAGPPPLSAAAKAKKIDEAKAFSKQGSSHLQKTMFQWTPDHIAAAPLFEKSATSYFVAGELQLSKLMYIQASDSYEISNSFATSANALIKAAQIAQV